MAIWRGSGGSGESSSDSTINITTQKAAEAAASAAAALVSENAAEAAQAAAEQAETNAETAETNAETAASTATTKASEASSSASSASTSATNAASSASAASTSATNAASSASSAATSESNASTSAATATTKASEASTSATSASSSASSASTSASTATTKASEASTSATNAASSASSASTSATSATASASTATTQATNAAASATTASTAATNASSSATAAATSETNAASSASSASTSATNASTSASTATTQATNAASSASAAATSETNAASSASAASTSASNASTSATNAATSETNAAASAASAASALDSFDDRYLGSKTSNPTLDNDGNALVTGALYYNSTDGEMRVYDGSQWIAASAASQAILTKYKYIATAGQTTFSGTDANSLTLAYTAGSIIVTLNGVVMDAADYTATTGTSVVLGAAASLNDELCVVAFSTFDVANAVAKTGDTMTGNLNFSGTGLRITGDFSNATVANRVMFQTNTANGNTIVGALTNGTATASTFNAYNSSDAVNNAYIQLAALSTEARLGSTITGTGSYLPMTFHTGGSERMRVDTSGNVGIGVAPTTLTAAASSLQVYGGASQARIGLQNATTGSTATSGFHLCAIGSRAILDQRSASSLEFTTDATERMRIDSSGNLLVGTTGASPFDSCKVAIAATAEGIRLRNTGSTGASSATMIRFLSAADSTVGSITSTGSATTYATSSDYRLKENVQPMVDALSKINALKPVTYSWKLDGSTSQGFIAHELAEVCPDAVIGEKDAVETYTDEEGNEQTRPVYQGIDTSFLVATLTAAIQELKAEFDAYKATHP